MKKLLVILLVLIGLFGFAQTNDSKLSKTENKKLIKPRALSPIHYQLGNCSTKCKYWKVNLLNRSLYSRRIGKLMIIYKRKSTHFS